MRSTESSNTKLAREIIFSDFVELEDKRAEVGLFLGVGFQETPAPSASLIDQQDIKADCWLLGITMGCRVVTIFSCWSYMLVLVLCLAMAAKCWITLLVCHASCARKVMARNSIYLVRNIPFSSLSTQPFITGYKGTFITRSSVGCLSIVASR